MLFIKSFETVLVFPEVRHERPLVALGEVGRISPTTEASIFKMCENWWNE